jgi:hypothetical protein
VGVKESDMVNGDESVIFPLERLLSQPNAPPASIPFGSRTDKKSEQPVEILDNLHFAVLSDRKI